MLNCNAFGERLSRFYQKIVYLPLLKLLFEAILSAKHVVITYTIVDNLQLTTILNVVFILSNFFMTCILADNLT